MPAGTVVPVTRPIAVRQLAAGLAAVAALVTGSGLALSLDTVEYSDEFTTGLTISRLAWGERVTGAGTEEFLYQTVSWGGPLVLAVVLLTAAAAAALVTARVGDRGPWARLAQLLAVAGGAVTAGVFATLWVFGRTDVSVAEYAVEGTRVTTQWGPLMGVLGVAVVLAGAAAATARRGRADVLATVEVRA
ncbi:hypothetical protein ACI78S_10405 [Geodermatophilus sp. SYSU D00815]